MPNINVVTQITDWNIGDILAGSAPGRSARIPGSTSAELRVLAQQGNGKNSAKPFWTSVGSIIPGLAAIATSGSASDLIGGTIPPLRFPALTGDVTTLVGSLATTISQKVVGNEKLSFMPPMTIKGNNSILAGAPKDLTVADLNAMGIGGGGGGSGTVTSVGLSMPAIFSVAGSPVTTAGTFTVTLATELANTVWAGPSAGAAATPTFRALVAADIPSLSSIYQPIDATLTTLSGLADAVGFLRNDGAGVLTWSAAGTGDVVGPASATDNAVTRFDGTTGKLIQNSTAILSDIGEFSTLTLSSIVNASQYASFTWETPSRRYTWALGGSATAAPDLFYLYDQTATAVRMEVSTAGAFRFNSYGAGFLQTDASGNVTAGAGPGGTVNSGTATQIAYYATTGTAVSSTPAFTIGASGNPSVTASGTNQDIILTPSGTGTLQCSKKVYFGDAIDTSASGRDFNIISTTGGIALLRTGSASAFVELVSRATATSSDIAYWDMYVNSNSSNLDDLTIRSRTSTNDNVLRMTKTVVSVLPTTSSTTASTGALVVAGGLGVAENIRLGGSLMADAGIIRTLPPTGSASTNWQLGDFSATATVPTGRIRVRLDGVDYYIPAVAV